MTSIIFTFHKFLLPVSCFLFSKSPLKETRLWMFKNSPSFFSQRVYWCTKSLRRVNNDEDPVCVEALEVKGRCAWELKSFKSAPIQRNTKNQHKGMFHWGRGTDKVTTNHRWFWTFQNKSLKWGICPTGRIPSSEPGWFKSDSEPWGTPPSWVKHLCFHGADWADAGCVQVLYDSSDPLPVWIQRIWSQFEKSNKSVISKTFHV